MFKQNYNLQCIWAQFLRENYGESTVTFLSHSSVPLVPLHAFFTIRFDNKKNVVFISHPMPYKKNQHSTVKVVLSLWKGRNWATNERYGIYIILFEFLTRLSQYVCCVCHSVSYITFLKQWDFSSFFFLMEQYIKNTEMHTPLCKLKQNKEY